MQGLNAVRVEEVIICLYKWLNPNTAIDEAIYKDCNVEEEIVRSLDIERVRAALKALTPEERDIIMNFHFWVLFSFIHQLVAVYTMVYTSANHISIRLNIIHY